MHLKEEVWSMRQGVQGGDTRRLLTLYMQSGREAPAHTVHAVTAGEEMSVLRYASPFTHFWAQLVELCQLHRRFS